MLHDIEKLAQDYASCCIDCWNGYDNYDQQVFQEVEQTRGRQIQNVICVPRFDKCEIVEIRYVNKELVELPKGVINCATITGYHEKSEIFITYNGWNMYSLCGPRYMCFIVNNTGLAKIYTRNFTGTIKMHYVKFGEFKYQKHYRVYQIGLCSSDCLKFAVYSVNKFNHTKQDLQTMWNYVYPGKRPKNKFLVHFRPMTQTYYARNLDRKDMLYSGFYSELSYSRNDIMLFT